jgi:hypothetical protein
VQFKYHAKIQSEDVVVRPILAAALGKVTGGPANEAITELRKDENKVLPTNLFHRGGTVTGTAKALPPKKRPRAFTGKYWRWRLCSAS